MPSKRKPGLWHGPRKVEVVTVKKAHRTDCVCGCRPEGRRLEVTEGSGRHAKKLIFCINCGMAWIANRKVEADRAIEYLTTGEGEIRL